ncbi:IDEAL domain-containing protein [Priestia aryabhattai]|mgnify:CR=1 FL=1|uniref:IDEAL domain-containing protein n=1 Tax=Priestia aryabhattai TaxID=412384 RepID=UPI001ADA1C91|nr:IDEAL domain-containing protein [Priestia aryabhattai]QTL52462.1 IDEAL domain-containing protein [Priestia aryabhattai]
MENNTSNEINQIETSISDEILVELFLSQSIKEFKKGKILEEIDQSLKNKNEEAFLRLTDELTSMS